MLIVDAGNSAVRAAVPAGSGAGEALRRLLEMPTPDDAAGLAKLVARLLDLAAEARAGTVALVSVRPELTAALAVVLPGLIVVDHRAPMPFAVAMDDRAAVGADRYCNIAAAAAQDWDDALVVDAGTATTFDLLRDGCFAGGLIAPGMAFAARRLGEEAARLSPQPFRPSPLEVGVTTAAAMSAGAWHVGAAGVVGVVHDLLDVYGPRPVVLTGGLAPMLHEAAPHVEAEWRLEPDWTLQGARLLAEAVLGA